MRAVLVLIGAWMFLSVPVALVVGRFLHTGSDSQANETRSLRSSTQTSF